MRLIPAKSMLYSLAWLGSLVALGGVVLGGAICPGQAFALAVLLEGVLSTLGWRALLMLSSKAPTPGIGLPETPPDATIREGAGATGVWLRAGGVIFGGLQAWGGLALSGRVHGEPWGAAIVPALTGGLAVGALSCAHRFRTWERSASRTVLRPLPGAAPKGTPLYYAAPRRRGQAGRSSSTQ